MTQAAEMRFKHLVELMIRAATVLVILDVLARMARLPFERDLRMYVLATFVLSLICILIAVLLRRFGFIDTSIFDDKPASSSIEKIAIPQPLPPVAEACFVMGVHEHITPPVPEFHLKGGAIPAGPAASHGREAKYWTVPLR